MNKQLVIKWVDGKPVPTEKPILSKDAVTDLPITVMSVPYKRTPLEIELHFDEDLEGMTNGEVMLLRMSRDAARGDHKAADMLLDRILGKPKMVSENKNLNFSYRDYLEEIADREESELKEADAKQSTFSPSE